MPDKVYNSGMKAKLSAVAAICVLIAAFLCCCVPEGEIPSGNGQEETPAEEENGEICEMKITIYGNARKRRGGAGFCATSAA